MLAHLNDTMINYSDTGSGEAVLFIHAFPLNSKMWEAQVEALSSRYRCICMDIRGLGVSETGHYPYTIDHIASDVKSLFEKLKLADAVICGLSMGGYIALRTAELYPDLVKGLILADTRTEADTNETKAKRSAQIIKLHTNGVSAFAEELIGGLVWEENLKNDPELASKIKVLIRTNNATGISAGLMAMAARPDTHSFLREFKKPALILAGEHDGITPPIVAQGMHESVEGSVMEIIPDAGHLSNLENHEAFNKALLDFLTANF